MTSPCPALVRVICSDPGSTESFGTKQLATRRPEFSVPSTYFAIGILRIEHPACAVLDQFVTVDAGRQADADRVRTASVGAAQRLRARAPAVPFAGNRDGTNGLGGNVTHGHGAGCAGCWFSECYTRATLGGLSPRSVLSPGSLLLFGVLQANADAVRISRVQRRNRGDIGKLLGGNRALLGAAWDGGVSLAQVDWGLPRLIRRRGGAGPGCVFCCVFPAAHSPSPASPSLLRSALSRHHATSWSQSHPDLAGRATKHVAAFAQNGWIGRKQPSQNRALQRQGQGF